MYITFKSRKFYFFTIVFVLFLLIALFLKSNLLKDKQETASKSGVLELKKEQENWDRKLNTASAADVYYELKKEYLDKPAKKQHEITHMFGEFLYQKMGLDAITVCDSAFAFGCFHGVFAKAIKDKGINIVPELDKICQARYGDSKLGCQHGIGHGILEYLGHQKLNEALSLCGQLSTEKAFLECDTGVFMEYNFPATMDQHTFRHSIRLAGNDIFAPCSNISEKHKRACYYINVQWWDKLYNSDLKKMGALCKSIKNSKESEACFLGIGDLLSDSTHFSPEKVIKDCQKMLDHKGQVLCRSGASGIFYAVLNYRHLAPELCKGLDPDSSKLCVTNSNFFLVK